MPNYVSNRLEVVCGNEQELNQFLSFVKGEDRDFDFNKIIPMPMELRDTSESSTCYQNLAYYLKETDNLDIAEEIKKKHTLFDMCLPNMVDKSESEIKDMFNDGKQSFNNFIKYGFVSWYGWSYANWGTKWNAMEVQIFSGNCDATILFDTAWSGVPMLIKKLTEIFPTFKFEYKYADEDFGCNVGYGKTNDNGEFEFTEIEDDSQDAINIATELWGYNYRDEFDEEFEDEFED
jgi:hypothetical protein